MKIEDKYLVASDFDGTLFINKDITEKDINAIYNFRQQGNKFVICTGRAINSVLKELNNYKIPFDYIIGVNGVIAVDKDLKVIYHHEINLSTVNKIQDILFHHDIKDYHLSNGLDFDVIVGNSSLNDYKVDKSRIRGYYIDVTTSENAINLTNELNEELEVLGIKAYTNGNYVAVGIKGIHKGYGVLNLVEKINFNGKVKVIGDDYNDIPMFKLFDSYGIKTGYSDAIKEAKYLTNSVSEVLENL